MVLENSPKRNAVFFFLKKKFRTTGEHKERPTKTQIKDTSEKCDKDKETETRHRKE